MLAPMISKRRSVHSPIRDVRPRRSLPPVYRWRGVKPSHTAKSRPCLKVAGGGARAVKAVAVKTPIPGIVINRRATSSFLARRTISRSSFATGS